MWTTPEIEASDAFVATWLPGTEGDGIAELIFRDSNESVAYGFRGRLSFSWPRAPGQSAVNRGDEDYDPLFPYGYGLRYADQGSDQSGVRRGARRAREAGG
jgi:beta-glucosidase